MKLAHDEVTLQIAKHAQRLKIDLKKISGIKLFAMVEALKHQDYGSRREAIFCVKEFLKREFKEAAA